MEKPLVSIVVPIYNSELHMEKCILSILRQSYENVEVILIDDGSTDNSCEICQRYEEIDCRIKVIRQENKGVSCARNAGISHSKGNYILFVDSDDEITETAVELMLSDAMKYKADIVSAVMCKVMEDGSVSNPYENKEYTKYEGIEALSLSLDGNRQTNSACAKLFKKEFIQGIYFREGRKVNEDGFFVFECYARQPLLIQHNICVYRCYIRNGSVSRSPFSEKYLDMFYFCEEKKRILREKYPELEEKMRAQEVRTHIAFLDVLCRTTGKKYREYEKNSIKVVKRFYKKDCSKSEHERKMAFVIKSGLYPIYKFAVRMRYYR